MRLSVYDQDGELHEVRSSGREASIMEVIRDAGLPITAECGGACACATCHVYVEEDGRNAAGPAGDDERAMLEFADAVDERSRLSCQMRPAPELDGMVLRLAPGT